VTRYVDSVQEVERQHEVHLPADAAQLRGHFSDDRGVSLQLLRENLAGI